MYEYTCTVLRIVDGDTLHVDADLGCDVHIQLTIRLDGINCPELATDAGKAAKVAATTWLGTGQRLILHTTKNRKEKYGRYLGTIYREGELASLNDWLIVQGHAVPYSGGLR
jgi:endonuclease YncB( thermonuclease family)